MDIKKYSECQVLKGKVAVITGAGSGIGKASAALFLTEGAKVVAADINYDSVAALGGEFPEYKDNIRPFKVDVSKKEEVEAMIDYAIGEFGKMDILFNNAGIMDGMIPVDELSDELWNKILRINTDSIMYACRKAVRYFLSRGEGGVILNTASVGGICGGRAGLAYTASKHAVVGMTKNIAVMYGDMGIRCNAICPGGIKTNIGIGLSKPSERGVMRMQKSTSTMDRMGDPLEIAAAAVFLSSDSATFVNGAILSVDGGWTAY